MATDLASAILGAASQLGINPTDLATAISYETAGTFNPNIAGPKTKWGQHRGLLQWGEPQAQKYLGGDFSVPSQMRGAVSYLTDAGVKPGMGLLDIYSAINAGQVGRYNASDAGAGGAPGTVRDKVQDQMAGHRQKAEALLARSGLTPEQSDFVKNNPQPDNFAGLFGGAAPFGSIAPTSSPSPLPMGVAQYAADDGKKGSLLGRAAKAFGNLEYMPAPKASAFPGGPSDAQANALTKYLNSPKIADLLLNRRA